MTEEKPNLVIHVDHDYEQTEHTLIVPGRRAFGEKWRKVTIGHKGDKLDVKNEPHEAPADGKPIMAMGVSDQSHIDEIIEAQIGKAIERSGKQPNQMSNEEYTKVVNEAWLSWIEQKLRWMKGQTTIGPGGMSQREKLHQNPATRPAWNR